MIHGAQKSRIRNIRVRIFCAPILPGAAAPFPREAPALIEKEGAKYTRASGSCRMRVAARRVGNRKSFVFVLFFY